MNPFLIYPKHNSKNWTFSSMTHRIELFLIRLTELNPFSLNMTKELDSYFLNMKQGIEPFNFWIWLKELNFLHMTQRMELFFEYDSKNWTIFLLRNMIHWKEPFFQTWLKELNPSVQHDSKNWILHSAQHDSQYWTLLFNIDS